MTNVADQGRLSFVVKRGCRDVSLVATLLEQSIMTALRKKPGQ